VESGDRQLKTMMRRGQGMDPWTSAGSALVVVELAMSLHDAESRECSDATNDSLTSHNCANDS
jgi:hypothetical protein